jgi:hypothetical protein
MYRREIAASCDRPATRFSNRKTDEIGERSHACCSVIRCAAQNCQAHILHRNIFLISPPAGEIPRTARVIHPALIISGFAPPIHWLERRSGEMASPR